jgi:daunorubicin resistance ABC transporter membrane protein
MTSRAMEHPAVAEGAARPRPSAFAFDLATVRVLWSRDLRRFFHQKSRVIGALVQPLIFLLVIGSGFSGSFRISGAEGVSYMQFFFPGILLMVVLFTSIFSTMSLIEDRREGFMQAVLAAPGSRTAVVLGKTLGGATLALVQAAAIVLLAPWAGFPYGSIAWVPLVVSLSLVSLALTAVGFAVAWWLDSMQGYHAVMSVLLIPAWIVSGAMFPLQGGPSWMKIAMAANPLTYAATALRRALGGGSLPAGLHSTSTMGVELAVVAGAAVIALSIATIVCRRRA